MIIYCILCLKCSVCKELGDNCGTNLDQAQRYSTSRKRLVNSDYPFPDDASLRDSRPSASELLAGWSERKAFKVCRQLGKGSEPGISYRVKVITSAAYN